MSEAIDTFSLNLSQPGIKRDGTLLDNAFYQDGQWVRFQRGRPRKIGGYRSVSNLLDAPVREVRVTPDTSVNYAHSFSQWGVERLSFTSAGVGSSVQSRTPAAFVPNADYTWQSDVMFDSGGGGVRLIIANASPDLADIASEVNGPLYFAEVAGAGNFAPIQDGSGDIEVSGGCVVLQPFLFVYGNNGLIRNSNANDISVATGWTGADANAANVAGTKFVKGLATRGGGQSPAGVFWALDALVRVTYVGGTVLWNYDTVSTNITVMSKSAIVEYDGIFFWPGVDRFYVYTGVVQELPNNMNQNWFFDNLNYAQRQKVWALKVPRFGEIWWFFPSGTSTECDKAVIYNVREQTWYDTRIDRSAGFPAQVFRTPVMAGELRASYLLTYSVVSGIFAINDIITGGTSGATGVAVKIDSGRIHLANVVGNFGVGENITGSTSGATGTTVTVPGAAALSTLWNHEVGVDRIYLQEQLAIPATIKTSNLQILTGGPASDSPAGPDLQTRLARLEPDFVMSGGMHFTVSGRSYAQGPDVVSQEYPFDSTTQFIDPREQRRQLAIEFVSNVLGGDFQMGRVLVKVEPGDSRG